MQQIDRSRDSPTSSAAPGSIQDIVEYINAEGESFLCNRGLNIRIKYIVEHINVAGASRPCNRGIKYFIKGIVEYTDVKSFMPGK
jgi:hypothetical protein